MPVTKLKSLALQKSCGKCNMSSMSVMADLFPRNGPTVIQRQPAIPQANYLTSLEGGTGSAPLTTGSVKYWSDFNRVHFHAKSIVQLNEYELNSSLMPFDNWDAGEDLFKSLDKEHDLLDRDLRPFVEEADHMQGIQIFAGIDDAWGGFAARYMDRLKDEYGKTTVWFWGVENKSKIAPRVHYPALLLPRNSANCP